MKSHFLQMRRERRGLEVKNRSCSLIWECVFQNDLDVLKRHFLQVPFAQGQSYAHWLSSARSFMALVFICLKILELNH